MNRSVFVVASAVCVSAVARAWIASNSGGPIVAYDEWLNVFNARDLFSLQGYYSVLYPPLYALLVAPMYVFHERFYEAGLAINAVLSATLAVPVFLLARQVMRPAEAAATAVLALCLPFELVLAPRMFKAENLSWPLFAMTCWSIVAGIEAKGWRAAAYDAALGALTAALALTKFNFLVAIPVVLVLRAGFLWTCCPWWKVPARIALGILAGAVVWAPWAVYGRAWGLSWNDVFGVSLVSGEVGPPRLHDLPFWFAVDAACAALILLPMLPPLVVPWLAERWRGLATLQLPWVRQQIVAIVFFAAYFNVTVVHSLSVTWYNIDQSNVMESRYFEFVQPLFLVCAVHGVLCWLRSPAVGRSATAVIGAWSALAVAAAGLGYLVSTGQLGGKVLGGFARDLGNHTITLLVINQPVFGAAWFGLAVIVAGALILRRGRAIVAAASFAVAVLAAVTGYREMTNYTADRFPFGRLILHARGVADVIRLNETDARWSIVLPPDIVGADRPSPHTSSYFATLAAFWSAWLAKPSLLDHRHTRLSVEPASSSTPPAGGATRISIFTRPQAQCIGSYTLPGSSDRYFVCKLAGNEAT